MCETMGVVADEKRVGPKNGRVTGNDMRGFLWVVIRYEQRMPILSDRYHIQGIADSEECAIKMCADDTYGIGPLPLNTALPHKIMEWVGFYYPLLQT